MASKSRKVIAIASSLAFLTCAGYIFTRLASCERKYETPSATYKAPTFNNPRAPKHVP